MRELLRRGNTCIPPLWKPTTLPSIQSPAPPPAATVLCHPRVSPSVRSAQCNLTWSTGYRLSRLRHSCSSACTTRPDPCHCFCYLCRPPRTARGGCNQRHLLFATARTHAGTSLGRTCPYRSERFRGTSPRSRSPGAPGGGSRSPSRARRWGSSAGVRVGVRREARARGARGAGGAGRGGAGLKKKPVRDGLRSDAARGQPGQPGWRLVPPTPPPVSSLGSACWGAKVEQACPLEIQSNRTSETMRLDYQSNGHVHSVELFRDGNL